MGMIKQDDGWRLPDELWQQMEPLLPQEIKHLRETSHVSQAVFAAMHNTSLSTIQKWEIGQKRPTGAALKLLYLVQKRGLEIVT